MVEFNKLSKDSYIELLKPLQYQEEIMPTVPYVERHFTANETVRDIVIGMADGLTVPFALAAGISGTGVAFLLARLIS
jgi:hypothetical protein